MMNLTTTHTDTSQAKLTVTGDGEVRIKLNRNWDDGHKQVIVNTVSKIAQHIVNQDLGVTVRGKFDPDKTRVIQMKTANKRNPVFFNYTVEDIVNG